MEMLKVKKNTKLKKDKLKKFLQDLYISNAQKRFSPHLQPSYLAKKMLKVSINFFCKSKTPLKL